MPAEAVCFPHRFVIADGKWHWRVGCFPRRDFSRRRAVSRRVADVIGGQRSRAQADKSRPSGVAGMADKAPNAHGSRLRGEASDGADLLCIRALRIGQTSVFLFELPPRTKCCCRRARRKRGESGRRSLAVLDKKSSPHSIHSPSTYGSRIAPADKSASSDNVSISPWH